MHIYCVKLDQVLDRTAFEEMAQYVSAEKKAKIQSFRKPIDATRSLVGDLIIRFILRRHYGFQNQRIRYDYQEFGKPYLPEHPHLHFNISHAGDWVVGVVASSAVGIDIEKVTDLKMDLSKIALTDEEYEQLLKLNKEERNSHFFELWTLKESYVKATGRGLTEGLNTLKISKHYERISIEKEEKAIKVHFELLECIEGYKFALCSFSKIVNKDMTLLLFTEFDLKTKVLLDERTIGS